MPFNCSLQLSKEQVNTLSENGEAVEGEEVEEEDGEEVSPDGIVSSYSGDASKDDLSAPLLTSSTFSSFVEDESNTYNTVRIQGKFIEDITNNGMHFQTLGGEDFYVFGGHYPYDPVVDNTVMLTLIYRGRNPRYNGHDFGGIPEYCFNQSKIRKLSQTDGQ